MDESKVRSIILRPPPGTRFSIDHADCVLQFEAGREQGVIDWLKNWISSYVEPLAKMQAQRDAGVKVDLNAPLEESQADATFQVALCLKCKERKIQHISGFCNTCIAQLVNTDNKNTSDDKKANENG